MKRLFILPLFLASCLLQGCEEPHPSDYTMHINIEDWTHKFEPKATKAYPITVKNRMKWDYKGAVKLHILQKSDTLDVFQQDCVLPKDATDTVWVDLVMPEAEGVYELVAHVQAPDGHLVKSRRIIEVEKPFLLPE